MIKCYVINMEMGRDHKAFIIGKSDDIEMVLL